VFAPAKGRFALRDLRVFGPGDGPPPRPIRDLRVTRHADDDRNATLTWSGSADADGYLVRFGPTPNTMYQNL
jgi:hypothetical protein